MRKIRLGTDGRFHTVYKITNIINKKVYIGKHSYKGEWNYDGSSEILNSAYSKYGIDSFKIIILGYFNDEDTAYNYEAKIVDTNFVRSKNTYNIKEGGRGAGIYLNREEIQIKSRSTRVERYGSLVGHMTTIEARENRKSSLIRKYGSHLTFLNSDEAKNKRKVTWRNKIELMNSDLLLPCLLINSNNEIVKSLNVIDMVEYLYGNRKRVDLIRNKLKDNKKYNRGPWLGHYLIYESSETIPNGSTLEV